MNQATVEVEIVDVLEVPGILTKPDEKSYWLELVPFPLKMRRRPEAEGMQWFAVNASSDSEALHMVEAWLKEAAATDTFDKVGWLHGPEDRVVATLYRAPYRVSVLSLKKATTHYQYFFAADDDAAGQRLVQYQVKDKDVSMWYGRPVGPDDIPPI
jgi:hypothetical protein